MLATSHFVGIKLRSEPLADLFAHLQTILGSDSGVAEFQNILSAHITLYYLPADIDADREHLVAMIRVLHTGRPMVRIGGFAYFGQTDTPRLCYLSPADPSGLAEAHARLADEFPQYAGIPDNAHRPYVPHLTFFRIDNIPGFLRKRSETEEAIADELAKIRDEDIFERVALFRVNSQFRPEMQIEIAL